MPDVSRAMYARCGVSRGPSLASVCEVVIKKETGPVDDVLSQPLPLEESTNAPAVPSGMTRRTLLKRLGLGAGVVVVVAAGGVTWRAIDQGVFSPGTGPAYARRL